MNWHRYSRDIHLYLGLLLGPVLIVFGLSTLLLNHPGLIDWKGGTEKESWVVEPVTVPEAEGLELGRAIAGQVGLSGEIDWVAAQPKENRAVLMLSRPGWYVEVNVDTLQGRAEVSESRKGFLDRLLYLHKRPGPHVANLRGNWWFVKAWAIVADSSVAAMLLLSITGVILWMRIKRERKFGFAMLAAGASLAAFTIWTLVGGWL